MTRLTFVGKPDCHLCEDAHALVDEVLVDFPAVEVIERSILDEPALFEAYVDEIPVVLIDDRVHTIWRVDEGRLRAALAAAIGTPAIDPAAIDTGPARS